MADSRRFVAGAVKASTDTEGRSPCFLRATPGESADVADRAMIRRHKRTSVGDHGTSRARRMRSPSPSPPPLRIYQTDNARTPPPDSKGEDGMECIHQVQCQTAVDPHFPTDVSCRLEIPISKDMDDELETFSRFKRLGDFAAAKSFLLKGMGSHLGDPYVLVQYAEMLLEMGNYSAFAQLTSQPSLGAEMIHAKDEEMQLLSLNLKLLVAKANTHLGHTGDSIDEADKAVSKALRLEHLKLSPELGATELRIVTLTSHLIAQMRSRSRFLRLLEVAKSKWVDWAAVSRHLLTSHRDWEFRDFVVAGATLFGQQNFAEMVSQRGDMDYCIPWDEFENDVSATLAHLDLLVSLLQDATPATDSTCMTKDRADAKSLASIVMSCHPRAMRSRTFGHWLLVETAMAGRESSEDGAHRLSLVKLMDLPRPTPRASEVPDWPGFQVPPTANEPIQTAFAMAKEMEDYKTQVSCYQLLAQRSSKPAQELRELSGLQATQGDHIGQHATRLARYYGCRDTVSQLELFNDILEFEDRQVCAYDVAFPQCHHFVKRALRKHLRSSGCPKKGPEPSNGDDNQNPSHTHFRSSYHGSEQRAAAFLRGGQDQVTVLPRPRYGANPGAGRGQGLKTPARHLAHVRNPKEKVNIINVKTGRSRVRPATRRRTYSRDYDVYYSGSPSESSSESSSPSIIADKTLIPGAAVEGAEEGRRNAYNLTEKPASKPEQDRIEGPTGEEAPEAGGHGYKPRLQIEVEEVPERASTGSPLYKPPAFQPPPAWVGNSGGASSLTDKRPPRQGGEETRPRPAEVTAKEADKEEETIEEIAIRPSKRVAGNWEENKDAATEEQNNKIEGHVGSLLATKLPAVPEKVSVAVEGAKEVE